MPLDYEMLQRFGSQPSFAEKFAQNYAAMGERQNRLSQLAQQQEMQGYQMRGLQRAEARAPIEQQRADLAYQQQQAEALRHQQEGEQMQGYLAGLPPEEQIAAKMAPKEYFGAKFAKTKPEDVLGEKRLKLQEKELSWRMGQKPTTQLEPPPKAPPGTRVYQEGGEWKSEVIKGTPQWQMYKSKEAPDRALVQNIVPQFEKNVSDIDKLVSSKGFNKIFGLIAGQTPNITKEAREAANLRAQVIGAMETSGMQLQRSAGGAVGSMTVQEWPKMQSYMNVIQNSNDPQAVKEALMGAQSVYDRMAEVAKEGYLNEWGSGQFGDPNVVARLSKGKPKIPTAPNIPAVPTNEIVHPQYPGFSIAR